MSTDQTSDIPPDPIYEKSLSIPIFLAGLAVLGATALVIVDEISWRRPYKAYQDEWKTAMTDFLDEAEERRRGDVENVFEQLEDYQQLVTAADDASKASEARRMELSSQIGAMTAEINALNEAIKSPRSEIAAVSYGAEHAADVAGKLHVADVPEAQPYLGKIEKIEAREITYEWIVGDKETGERKSNTATVGELLLRAPQLQVDRSALQLDLAAAGAEKAAAEARVSQWKSQNLGNVALLLEELDDDVKEQVAAKVSEVGAAEYLDRYTTGLTAGQIAGIRKEIQDFGTGWGSTDLKQIHIPDSNNWVDRCETCHLNSTSPIPVTADQLDTENANLFESHPRAAEIFGTHDPQKFGCSMCHGGNGVAVTSVEYAHGLNHYWLHRLHPPMNIEAGCVQCHQKDLVLPGGDRVTQGKENFRSYGCWGCHPMPGYGEEPMQVRELAKQIADIDAEILRLEQREAGLQAVIDPLYDIDEDRYNELSAEIAPQKAALKLEIAGLLTERTQLAARRHDLSAETKKVGPNLKDLKAKVKPQWLTQWVSDPVAWRPTTKMPSFRWANEEEAKDVAAFLWQSATDVAADPSAYGMERGSTGDPTAGEELFRTVGCMACHSMGSEEDGTLVGNTFAANLSNLGEKSNLEHVVRWVKNPRHRLAPYCAECGTDKQPEAFTSKSFVFGRETTECPDCGQTLNWDNPTVMPSFRLSDKEARDIATYLVSQRGSGVDFPSSAPWLDDTDRFERGRRLVQHFGCAGCHEIAGLEGEGRIGTALATWGSTPLERLDFGHYTIDAKRGIDPLKDWVAPGDDLKVFSELEGFYEHNGWYNHRGFAMHKLAEPDIFDTSKNLSRFELLRMPKFRLSGQEINDITTFLMGTKYESVLPESVKYRPDEEGRAIRDGWWVVRKYNCEGCHQIRPGEVPDIQKLPHFMDGQENAGDRPPYLVGTGFRTEPGFLADFLRDPALGGGTDEPKSLRPHLSVRMPTFEFTEDEIGRLVAFFDAMAKQPRVYKMPPLEPLTATERKAAEVMFADANCLSCHVVTGRPLTSETKAPNLTYTGSRLRPEWVARWLQDPQVMEPGTPMPALFRKQPSGRWTYMNTALPEVAAYEGDHVELMVRYLRSLAE